MVADECECYYANGFEDAGTYDQGAIELALGLGRYAEGLCDDGYNDDCHTD